MTANGNTVASNGVLLTGATGFVGMELLSRYLEQSDRPVYALVRAADEREATARLRGVIESLCGDGNAYAERVVAVPGDIERPRIGLDDRSHELLASRVSRIVHAAASVSFSLPLPESRRINVAGTRRLLELAQRCEHLGGLERFSYVSTAYVAGDHHGEFGERDVYVGQKFRNPYEQSKFEAETLVRSHERRLPIEIFRPSIVVGEARSGWTASFNVLYAPIKAFVRGTLPALPARRSSPVDVVPVDYVADAMFELSSRELAESRTYHLVAGDQATTVGHLIDLSARHLGRTPPVVIPPALYGRVVHPLLARAGRKTVRRGLERSRAFFPYFSMKVSYANNRARELLDPAGVRVPPIDSYFGRLLDFAIRSRWGRETVSRAEALRTAPKPGSALTFRPEDVAVQGTGPGGGPDR